ncbi:MAG: amidohydrolase family protein, partial [Allosphingosinicella sp.]
MRFLIALFALLLAAPAPAEGPQAMLLRPARVFDGADPRPHEGWQVLVRGDRIEAVGPGLAVPAGASVVDLPGATLMPGM